MNYTNDFQQLQLAFSNNETIKEYDTIEILESAFKSHSCDILPGVKEYHCSKHHKSLNSNYSFSTDVGQIKDHVHLRDIYVEENKKFNYQIIRPKNNPNQKKVVFLFHGFNEKDWSKYLPWAKSISENTGSSVILFPIAFHMQRAPKYWSSKREMFSLSKNRQERFPNIVNSTLSNVAISMRLHSMPQRFIWSGLQTYYDVIQLIELIREGKHEYINADFEFDIFAYSIGGFLAQILKLTNHKNYFDQSKVCLFCSGSVFNRLSPVSKFIIDSEANVALYSYLVEHFDNFLQKDSHLHHYIEEDHLEGKIFYSMLDYQKMRGFREDLLKKYESDIYAITLVKDKVIPSFEVINTLKGAYRDINIRVDEIDFDRDYTHENPFPLNSNNPELVHDDFNRVFEKVNAFLNQ